MTIWYTKIKMLQQETKNDRKNKKTIGEIAAISSQCMPTTTAAGQTIKLPDFLFFIFH